MITPLSERVGLRLVGEVDISNRLQLRNALAQLPVGGGLALHLELSGLRFMDIAGARELIAPLESRRYTRLVLDDPPLSLRRIIGLAWPGAEVHIRMSRS